MSIRLYVVESVSCLVYSSLNHVMGTRAHPIFLSVLVRIMSLCLLKLWIWDACDCVMLRCCGLKRLCKVVSRRVCHVLKSMEMDTHESNLCICHAALMIQSSLTLPAYLRHVWHTKCTLQTLHPFLFLFKATTILRCQHNGESLKA